MTERANVDGSDCDGSYYTYTYIILYYYTHFEDLVTLSIYLLSMILIFFSPFY